MENSWMEFSIGTVEERQFRAGEPGSLTQKQRANAQPVGVTMRVVVDRFPTLRYMLFLELVLRPVQKLASAINC